MRRKCEAAAVPDAGAKLLSFQRFRAAAGARGGARKHVMRDVRRRQMLWRGASPARTARRDVGERTLRHRVTPPAVGRCPPPRRAELLDRANFHKYNFFVIVRQRASRED